MIVFFIPQAFLLKDHLLILSYDKLLPPQLFAHDIHLFLKIFILMAETMVLPDQIQSFPAKRFYIRIFRLTESEQQGFSLKFIVMVP